MKTPNNNLPLVPTFELFYQSVQSFRVFHKCVQQKDYYLFTAKAKPKQIYFKLYQTKS